MVKWIDFILNQKNNQNYTKQTRLWLNKRFDVHDSLGVYVPNQPSYGFSPLVFRLEEYCRTFSILNGLKRYSFNNLLDVGCADGYFMGFVEKHLHWKAFGTDLSDRALVQAKALYNVQGVSADAHSLPFDDNAFDVVVASEVLEHVVDPTLFVQEIFRVAKYCVVLTTPRAADESDVQRHFQNLDPGEPHAHIHYFTDETIRELFTDIKDKYPVIFSGARSRWGSRLFNFLGWGDESTACQREAYLEFTLNSCDLSETSKSGIRENLVQRYKHPSKWRKCLAGRPLFTVIMMMDVLLSKFRLSWSLDHLILIKKVQPIPLRTAGLSLRNLIYKMFYEFEVPFLRIKK